MANRNYCLADQSFTNSGNGEAVFVAVVRERGERPLEVGGFLVDLGCTGIKDAFYTQIERGELEAFKRDAFRNGCREASAAWGRKLIEDALAYAKSLGLKPHHDYKKAARVMGGVRASDCDEVFHFGQNGKPLYFQGKHSDAEARRMIDHLNRRLGADGFVFIVEATTALSDTLEERVEYFLSEAEAGRLKHAKAGLEKLTKEYPEEATVHFARGVVRVYDEDHEQALAAFDQAIELNPEFVEAWMNKAAAHQKLGGFVEMIQAFRRVLELTPPEDEFHLRAKQHIKGISETMQKTMGLTIDAFIDAEALYAEAVSYIDIEDYERAIELIKGNPERLPTNERTLTLLGTCYRGLKEWDLARNALEQALEIDPMHYTAQVNLTLLDAEEKGIDPASKVAELIKKLQQEVKDEGSSRTH